MNLFKSFIVFSSLTIAAASHAFVIFDNTEFNTGTTFRSAGDAPGLVVTNTNATDVQLTRVAFEGRNFVAQNFKFFLADSNGNVLDAVIVAYGTIASDALIGADVNWNLVAGSTYTIAAMSESGQAAYNFLTPGSPTSQNGLTAGNNTNWSGFVNPTLTSTGAAEMAWQLESVPEPATMTMLGLGVAALVARRRRSA